MSASLPERIEARIKRLPETGCWIWTGALSRQGYSYISVKGRMFRVHRLTYEAATGSEIPAGLVIDHLCRVRSCVNPDHLEAVTPLTNWQRGKAPSVGHAMKTACPQGHPYDAKNTYTLRGKRRCRRCHAALMRRRKAAALAARGDR
jgi:hypothetical protein